MFENIKLAFQGIWSHKMRSFLTMLGIIIGIAAIIAIVSTIKGTNEQIKNNVIGSGNNTVNVVLSQGGYEYTIDEYTGIPAGITEISDETMEKIRQIDQVEDATAYKSRMISDSIYYQDTSLSELYIYGIDDSYFRTVDYIVKLGRGFNDADYSGFKKNLIMDEKAALNLFGDENPIGKTVDISSQPFTVIGVVKARTTFTPDIDSIEDYYTYNQSNTNGMLYIPKSTWPVIYQYDEPENVTVKATSTDDMTQAGRKTVSILNSNISPTDTTISYMAQDLNQRASQLQQLTGSNNVMLIWIAGISLLVGGIGVMNIMLVSVTERTSEIGLKKAIGARKSMILGQFLTEAAVLTSLGGLLGVISGVGAAQVIHQISGTPVAIDVPASIIAVVFSMVIGIVFGFLPSVQAANLDPIEALRRE